MKWTGGLALIFWRYHVSKPGFIHLGRGIGWLAYAQLSLNSLTTQT